MDVAKENPATVPNRLGLKNVSVTYSASKKLTALSDVRNTVHKKNIGELSSSKQFLGQHETRGLSTPTPRRKQTPVVKRVEDVDTLQETVDDYYFTKCRCNLNDEVMEDDFLPEELQFTDADFDNLTKIWLGQGGRDVEDKFVFSPLKLNANVDFDVLLEKPDFTAILANDSGIELDIELESYEIH